MKKLSYLLFFSFLISIPFQLAYLYNKNNTYTDGVVAGIQNRRAINTDVNVFAFVGDHYFNLYGYTSPQALVTFEGMGIFDQVTADNNGYFIFNVRFSPSLSREACLSSKDQFGRVSSPVCLPPFPVDDNFSIGPVIMPPTVSLNNPPAGGGYFMGDRVILSGQAIPNTDVKFAVFGEDKNNSISLIKSVEAFTFPGLTTQSDDKGNFSVTLPSSNPKKFRLFAQANFDKAISPNSVNLNFEILSVWMIIVRLFTFIFSLIRPRIMEIAIILEIIYVISLLLKHQSKAIILYKSRLPVIEEKKPLIKY